MTSYIGGYGLDEGVIGSLTFVDPAEINIDASVSSGYLQFLCSAQFSQPVVMGDLTVTGNLIVASSNFVTINTIQTITALKTFTAGISADTVNVSTNLITTNLTVSSINGQAVTDYIRGLFSVTTVDSIPTTKYSYNSGTGVFTFNFDALYGLLDGAFGVDPAINPSTGTWLYDYSGILAFRAGSIATGTIGAFAINTSNLVSTLSSTFVPQTRSLTAGDGLSGGGDLSVDRSFAVDSTVVRTTRTVTAGDGLSGGGDLSANRTFTVDSTVVRTSRNINVSGGLLTGGGSLASDVTIALASATITGLFSATAPVLYSSGVISFDTSTTALTAYPLKTTTISAGTGLTGGGDLSANRTLSADTSYFNTNYVTISTAQTVTGRKTFQEDSASASTYVGLVTNSASREVGTFHQRTGTGATDATWYTYIPGSSTDLRFYSAGDILTLKTSGRVGINTASPAYGLHVNGTMNARQLLDYGSTSTTGSGTSPIYVDISWGQAARYYTSIQLFLRVQGSNSSSTNNFHYFPRYTSGSTVYDYASAGTANTQALRDGVAYNIALYSGTSLSISSLMTNVPNDANVMYDLHFDFAPYTSGAVEWLVRGDGTMANQYWRLFNILTFIPVDTASWLEGIRIYNFPYSSGYPTALTVSWYLTGVPQ